MVTSPGLQYKNICEKQQHSTVIGIERQWPVSPQKLKQCIWEFTHWRVSWQVDWPVSFERNGLEKLSLKTFQVKFIYHVFFQSPALILLLLTKLRYPDNDPVVDHIWSTIIIIRCRQIRIHVGSRHDYFRFFLHKNGCKSLRNTVVLTISPCILVN